MAKQIRCPNKHGWFDAQEACPKCGYAPTFNKALRTSKLNNHLHQMAANA